MPATEAIASYGLTLQWNAQPLAEVRDVSGPGIRFDTIDVTHYGSPSAFKEFIGGFGDGGEVTLECNLIPSDTPGQVAFINDAVAKTKRAVLITSSVAAIEWSFNAVVTALDFKEPLTEQLSFTATLKISGVPNLGITASTGMATLTGIEETLEAALVFNPVFAIGKFLYLCDPVDAASDWVKLLPTAAGHTITITYPTGSQTVTSGDLSGPIALGAANSVTEIKVKVQETGKVPKTYTIYVARPS